MILIDTKELCAALDMDAATVWRLVRRGDLPDPYAVTGASLAFWRVDEVFSWTCLPLSAAVLIWGQLVRSGRIAAQPAPQQAAKAATYV
jgi:predicted DNA-binding transcriptional regulator AlpA